MIRPVTKHYLTEEQLAGLTAAAYRRGVCVGIAATAAMVLVLVVALHAAFG